jgi:hypothetical protein
MLGPDEGTMPKEAMELLRAGGGMKMTALIVAAIVWIALVAVLLYRVLVRAS